MRLLTVCAMKSTLSISDIKAVFDNLYSDEDFGIGEMFGCYEKGIMAQQRCCKELNAMLSKSLEEPANQSERFASLMAVCAMSDALSELAKRMAAEYFPAQTQKKKP